MFAREIVLFRYIKAYLHRLLADIDEAEMTFQPSAGINTPAWIVGHLAIANDYTGKYLGVPMICPSEWTKLFSPGTPPTPADGKKFPSKPELVETFERGLEAIIAAAATAQPEAMAQPHDAPIEFLQVTFPTKGDFVAHLMTTHPATHLGQLSMWRRLTGRPTVLG